MWVFFSSLIPTTLSLLLFSANASEPYRYLTYTEIVSRLSTLAEKHPNIIKLETAQERYEKYGLNYSIGNCENLPCKHHLITLADRQHLHPETPEIFLSGAVHGNEVLGPNTIIYMLEYIAENYKREPELLWLLQNRALYAYPITNPQGYANKKREENNIDPNRDFPPNSKCMRTQTAQAVNELFREHLFRSGITFHGGMRSLSYLWGNYKYSTPCPNSNCHISLEAPDHTAQVAIGDAMRYAAGFSPQAKLSQKNTPLDSDYWYSIYGPMSDTVYPVDGGMEDWAYSASWDQNNLTPCPTTTSTSSSYNATARTVYDLNNVQALIYLAEMDDFKMPPDSTYGAEGILEMSRFDSIRDGHIARNARMAMKLMELAEPEFLIESFKIVRENNGSILTLSGRAVGCEKVDFIKVIGFPKSVCEEKEFDDEVLELAFKDESKHKVLYSGVDLLCSSFSVWERRIGSEASLRRLVVKVEGVDLRDVDCVTVAARFDSHWKNQKNPKPDLTPQTHLVRQRVDENYYAEVTDVDGNRHIVRSRPVAFFPRKLVVTHDKNKKKKVTDLQKVNNDQGLILMLYSNFPEYMSMLYTPEEEKEKEKEGQQQHIRVAIELVSGCSPSSVVLKEMMPLSRRRRSEKLLGSSSNLGSHRLQGKKVVNVRLAQNQVHLSVLSPSLMDEKPNKFFLDLGVYTLSLRKSLRVTSRDGFGHLLAGPACSIGEALSLNIPDLVINVATTDRKHTVSVPIPETWPTALGGVVLAINFEPTTTSESTSTSPPPLPGGLPRSSTAFVGQAAINSNYLNDILLKHYYYYNTQDTLTLSSSASIGCLFRPKAEYIPQIYREVHKPSSSSSLYPQHYYGAGRYSRSPLKQLLMPYLGGIVMNASRTQPGETMVIQTTKCGMTPPYSRNTLPVLSKGKVPLMFVRFPDKCCPSLTLPKIDGQSPLMPASSALSFIQNCNCMPGTLVQAQLHGFPVRNPFHTVECTLSHIVVSHEGEGEEFDDGKDDWSNVERVRDVIDSICPVRSQSPQIGLSQMIILAVMATVIAVGTMFLVLRYCCKGMDEEGVADLVAKAVAVEEEEEEGVGHDMRDFRVKNNKKGYQMTDGDDEFGYV